MLARMKQGKSRTAAALSGDYLRVLLLLEQTQKCSHASVPEVSCLVLRGSSSRVERVRGCCGRAQGGEFQLVAMSPEAVAGL
jgi:hypothetical protein